MKVGWKREVGGEEEPASPSALPVSGLEAGRREEETGWGAPLSALPLPPQPPRLAARSPADPAPATAGFGATAPSGARPSGQGGEVPSSLSGESATEDSGVLEPTGAGRGGGDPRLRVGFQTTLGESQESREIKTWVLGSGVPRKLSSRQAPAKPLTPRCPVPPAPCPAAPRPLTAGEVQGGPAQGVGPPTLRGV